MENEFAIVEKSLGDVIEIEERTPIWRMPATFARDYRRIATYLDSQGAVCAGMPYARYLDMVWEAELGRGRIASLLAMVTRRWHYLAGMPSSKPLPGEGVLQAGRLATRRYARMVHHGPYQDSGRSYRALYEWLLAQGEVADNEAIECYLNDPREVGREQLETEILIPLK